MRTQMCALGVAAAVFLVGCGGKGSPTTPTPPPPPAPTRTVIAATMSATVTARTDTGIAYTMEIVLTETGGVAANINTLDLFFYAGTQLYATAGPLPADAWDGGTRLLANGTRRTKTIIVTDTEPSQITTRTEARVTYTDDKQNTGSVVASANNPQPPAPTKHTLTGTVKAGTSSLRDVKIEIRMGANAGRSTKTDSKGQYRLTDLTWDWFPVRASKTGYTAVEEPLLLSANTTLNFSMKKATTASPQSWAGTPRRVKRLAVTIR
jgi:hypothetical protein